MRSEQARTIDEITTDKALLLSLFHLAEKKSPVGSVMKAQKLAFLSAAPMFEENMKAFSLEFFRFKFGPISKGVYLALDDFSAVGLMSRTDYRLSTISKEGRELAEAFIEDVLRGIPENAFCFDRLNLVVNKFSNRTALELRDHVYEIQTKTVESNTLRKIKDIPFYEHFTLALDPEDSRQVLSLPEDWLSTMSIELNPQSLASIERAMSTELVELPKIADAPQS